MSYETILLPRAVAELDNILGFLQQRSPQGAATWAARWNQVLADLMQNPLRFGIAPESGGFEREVRQVLFKTPRGRIYRALFTIVEMKVYILHLRGPGQNLVALDELGTP